MAAIEHISWSELLKHANITAQHGNDGNRIATATESLQQIAHQFAEELNERAKLLANSAQFDRALHDAAAIRAMLPGSGLGYLCTGDVYCQQGRHAAAISIYDQGLEAVSASDPYYHHLQQHRMQVAPNNNKRVDFISRLPLDIVITNIVPRMTPTYLDSNELYGPLYVSRTWQERILQQSKGLTFEFGQEDHTFKTGHDQLIRFAPYVQKLRGNVFDDAELKDLFSRARFSNLKDLRIYCDSTTPHLPVLHGLQLISDSLTHLNIDGYHYFDLSDILESCPNLVSLETEHVEPVLSSPPSSRYPKITHLALHDVSEDEAPSHDDVIDLLSRFPSLLSFELTPMSDSSILMTIHEHCPYLQVLYYGAKNYPSKKIDIHPNQKGIKSAHLGGEYTEDLFMQGDLVQFLYMHRNLLESVGFSGEFEADDSLWKLVDGNSGALFMRLTSLDLSGSRPYLPQEIITWLISNAPNLKNIALNESYLQLDVANAMINSTHLAKLEINQARRNDDFEGIIRFLNHHIEMGDTSTLEEITITTRKMTSDATWLSLISKLQCLKNLNLRTYCIPADCLPAMEEIGQGCPALEELTLGKYNCDIGDGIIGSFCQHSNIKCLKIGSRSLSSVSLMLLTSTFSSLEQLYVRCNLPESVMMMLKNKHVSKIVINTLPTATY